MTPDVCICSCPCPCAIPVVEDGDMCARCADGDCLDDDTIDNGDHYDPDAAVKFQRENPKETER